MKGKTTAKYVTDEIIKLYNKGLKQMGKEKLTVDFKCKKSLLNKNISLNTKFLTLDEFLQTLSKSMGSVIIRDGNKIKVLDKNK